MTTEYDKMARVVQIQNEHTAVINRGEKHGIKKGDHFLIFGLGEPVVDFETEENLGRLEMVRGRVEVVHVQHSIATVKSAVRVEVGTRRKIYTKPISSGLNSLIALSYGGKQEEIIEEPSMELVELDAERGDYAKPI